MLQIWMPEANGTWHWSIGETWLETPTLEQLIRELEVYQGKEAVVFFPSRQLQLLQQTLSKTQYKQLGIQGAAYLLEEYVVLPIDVMHIQQCFKQPNTLNLLSISRNNLDALLGSLQLLPIKIIALLPDFLTLPVPDVGQTIVAHVCGRLLVREQEYVGASVDDFSLYLDYQSRERHYAYSHLKAQQIQALLAIATEDQLSEFDYQITLPKKVKQHPWNIFPTTKKKTTQSVYWQACAAVFAGIVCVQLGYDGIRWYQSKRVAERTAVQAIEQYKAWFGENTRVTEQNIKSQFESQLRINQTADSAALQLLSRVGPTLMQYQVIAETLSYDAQRLDVALVAHTSQSLQSLTQQLNQQGFRVKLGNITPHAHGVMGQVSIE